MSGLHRRLLDGSTRQLAVPIASNPDETTQSTGTCEQMAGGSINSTSTISNSTSSLTASTTNASISNQSNIVVTASSISTPLVTTFLSSTGGHPMAPSSCLALRRPSTNTFVTTFKCIHFVWFFYLSFSITNFRRAHIRTNSFFLQYARDEHEISIKFVFSLSNCR